jgi:hypothetical protein
MRSIHLQPFDDETGGDFLVHLLGRDNHSEAPKDVARKISHVMGGLPLALGQIGAFINHRQMPINDFLPLYERHSARIHAKRAPKSDYEHALSTVWDISFEKLPKDSTQLLNLLAFMDPDGVDEQIFIKGSAEGNVKEAFPFLEDEMEYVHTKPTCRKYGY